MTPGQTARLLAAAAMFDARRVEREDAHMWHQVVGDLDYDDAMEAVRRHYAESTERTMPAHIRAICKAIRAERRRSEPVPERSLPSRFEEDWQRQARTQRGAASCREVVAEIAGRLAEASPPPVSALDQLRELTAGPEWTDADMAGEEAK